MVYNTAIKHLHYIQSLRVIPVSGIHPTIFDLNVSAPGDPPKTFFHKLYSIQASAKAMGKPPKLLFSSIESSYLTEKTGKWYFLTTDELYNDAITFIDHQLVDIYHQAGFSRLSQTKKSPFHRGPHRLTKMSEAAATHIHQLKHQVVPTTIPKIAAVRPTPVHINYDDSHFPPLPSKTPLRTTKTATATSHNGQPSSAKSIPKTSSLRDNRMEELEKKILLQHNTMTNLQTQIQEQQSSLDRLTKMLETQQQTITALTTAVQQLTDNMKTFETVINTMTPIHRKDPPPPSPDHPIKRVRIREDNSSSAAIDRYYLDSDMDETTNWESQDPNMTVPNSSHANHN